MLKAYPQSHACIDSLLPVGFASADAGMAGAITSLASVTASLTANAQHWARRARQWSRLMSSAPIHRTLYETALHEGAELLFGAWQASQAQRGWLVAEIEPSEMHGMTGLLRRARELANLRPNVMVSVPVSALGCEVIEELVATGHAVNASLCFSVAQVQAGLAAIRRGRQRALSQGVSLTHTRHLISLVAADSMELASFAAQAAEVGVELSAMDLRWAQMALYRALGAAMLGAGESVSLMVCGPGPHACAGAAGRQAALLYSLDEEQCERMIADADHHQPRAPGAGVDPVPAQVMERLLRVPAFRQLCGADPLSSASFACHPVFLKAVGQSLRAYTRLLGFARQLNPPLHADIDQSAPPLRANNYY